MTSPPCSLRLILESLVDQGLVVSSTPDLSGTINGITDDSRRVVPGNLFVAVRGTGVDGHRFLPQAHERGARAAIIEAPGSTALPHILVSDSRAAAAIAAAGFYRFPARELSVAGVTGTNGKTTIVSLLSHLLHAPARRAASIGTLGVRRVVDAPHGGKPVVVEDEIGGEPTLTTPGAIELQRTLRELLDSGIRAVAMEVSSHSLDQRRVDGIEFQAAVFTNLSRDHIDYHHDMEAYFAAKARLTSLVADEGTAIVNADDEAWLALDLAGKRVLRYSVKKSDVDVSAADVAYTATGSRWKLRIRGEQHAVTLPLIGDFNVSNAVAAAAAAASLGVHLSTIAERLCKAPQVPGRMERLNDSPVVLRDYAHTPDALERALLAVRPFAPAGVTVVFGCGGDRDRGKRPQMGAIAGRLADRVIITSDNPRTENPEAILDEIAAGIKGREFDRIENRRDAITDAISHAGRSGHLVLLAGKGHETYQIRGTERLHFDEKEIVEELVTSGAAARGKRGRR